MKLHNIIHVDVKDRSDVELLEKRPLVSSLEHIQYLNLRFDANLHCKVLPHENYRDWELWGPCRENLHYLWKRAVRNAGKPLDIYRSCNYHGVSPQSVNITGVIHNKHRVSFKFFSIDSAGFPFRDPLIPSPCSFHGVQICSVLRL